jgi:hypothetical protein
MLKKQSLTIMSLCENSKIIIIIESIHLWVEGRDVF